MGKLFFLISPSYNSSVTNAMEVQELILVELSLQNYFFMKDINPRLSIVGGSEH